MPPRGICGKWHKGAIWIKYITPFGYADGSEIVSTASLDAVLIVIDMAYAVIAVILAFRKYTKKDIA